METIILNFDPKHHTENWGIDQYGVGWGWFSGTIAKTCSFCGEEIVFGWRNTSADICREHVDDSAIFNQPKPTLTGVKL